MVMNVISEKEGTIVFPSSVQSDLFNYLSPEQQAFVRPVLRVLKKPAQEELCYMLLDYLESGRVTSTCHFVVGGMFNYLTRQGMSEYDRPSDPRIIRPLHICSIL